MNPILRKTSGVVTGTAHGSIVEGPDGNLWQFYTIVMSNPPGGRRVGMDPVGFDERGNLFVRGPSETPQWGPGAVADPARRGDSGSLPLTINKMRAMNTRSAFSSQRPGHEAAYAVDNSTGTWWEPTEEDRQPSITIDLGPATEFDPGPACSRSTRAASCSSAGRGPGRPGTTPQAPASTSADGAVAHRYTDRGVERRQDVHDACSTRPRNAVTRYVEFDELPPTTCRFVRLTLADWPRRAAAPLGIVEFTVFGKAVSPSAMPDRDGSEVTCRPGGEPAQEDRVALRRLHFGVGVALTLMAAAAPAERGWSVRLPVRPDLRQAGKSLDRGAAGR